jgi:hypothetical protein
MMSYIRKILIIIIILIGNLTIVNNRVDALLNNIIEGNTADKYFVSQDIIEKKYIENMNIGGNSVIKWSIRNVILHMQTINNEDLIPVKCESNLLKGKNIVKTISIMFYYKIVPDGIILYGKQISGTKEIELFNGFILKNPINIGKSWSTPIGEFNIEGTNETVKVPAGTFTHCVKTHHVGQDMQSQSQNTYELTVWYAPNIGAIKAIEKWSLSNGETTIKVRELLSIKTNKY